MACSTHLAMPGTWHVHAVVLYLCRVGRGTLRGRARGVSSCRRGTQAGCCLAVVVGRPSSEQDEDVLSLQLCSSCAHRECHASLLGFVSMAATCGVRGVQPGQDGCSALAALDQIRPGKCPGSCWHCGWVKDIQSQHVWCTCWKLRVPRHCRTGQHGCVSLHFPPPMPRGSWVAAPGPQLKAWQTPGGGCQQMSSAGQGC